MGVRLLPPLNSLRAFEAAARSLSFVRAAEELHVTPAAISQQVKALEAYLGIPLFRRLRRGLLLTDAGQACLPGLSDGFARLAAATDLARRTHRTRYLTVSVAPSFCSKWLVPRLDRFRQRHPQVEVRVDASMRLANFGGDGVDIAIRYGSGGYPGMWVERLLDDEVAPVCSPTLLGGEHPLREPADLRWHTLLHIDWTAPLASWPDWEMWLRSAGVDGVDVRRGPHFSLPGFAIEAALQGHGVALGSRVLVAGDLAAERLVRPFAQRLAVDFAYYVVSAPDSRDDPQVTAFRRWLSDEAAGIEGGGQPWTGPSAPAAD